MNCSARRRRYILAIYLMVVASILFADRLTAPSLETGEDELIFISDTDSIDAGRDSNSVYRIRLDGGGMKRIVGSIRHGDDAYLRISDIDCHAPSQSLVIASHQHDLNGFHHALLDGSKLHLDRPAVGSLLTSLRHIALAPDGVAVIVSRQYEEFSRPRWRGSVNAPLGLVAGDLKSREYKTIKSPTAERSYLSPDWSPDGGRITYIIEAHQPEARPSYALAIAAPDGSDGRIIHETTLALTDVAWSPDGDWLAVEMGLQIYKLRPDGSDLTRLSNHHAGASNPRWSPDGARISFVAPSSFPGFNQLITMDADGQNILQVSNIRGEVVNGCWL